MLRIDPKKGDWFDNFRPITLLNIRFKLLARVLATCLALVEDSVGEAQTCASPKMSIEYNLNLMRYMIDKSGCKTWRGGTLASLYQSKTFDRTDNKYSAGFGPVFSDWIAAMHSKLCSAVRVNGHLSEHSTLCVRSGKAYPSCLSCTY